MTATPPGLTPNDDGPVLYTPAEAAERLRLRASWLRKRATARAIPTTFVGKHLRFSDNDLAEIIRLFHQEPVTRPQRRHGGRR